MNVLWSRADAQTVRTVQEALQPRALAYTTVMTVLERLYRKGLVTREAEGRAYAYRPSATRAEHTAALMADALATSDDRSAALVSFTEQLSAHDVAALKQVLSAHRKRADSSRTKP